MVDTTGSLKGTAAQAALRLLSVLNSFIISSHLLQIASVLICDGVLHFGGETMSMAYSYLSLNSFGMMCLALGVWSFNCGLMVGIALSDACFRDDGVLCFEEVLYSWYSD